MKKTTQPKSAKPILTGIDAQGRPVDVFPGDIAIQHIAHDAGCPGGHGRPDLCRCKPDVFLEVIHRRGQAWN